ncbi:MAG: hypothetical protein HY317_05145 [Acidobacteria bacterium]|nr:hypothetical protein [Acidobacteriota bacterium]
MRVRLRARPRPRGWRWVRYALGRFLQVTGLMVTLVAATAYFGTPSTTSMLRMMLVGVLLFLPGWLLARHDPSAGGDLSTGSGGERTPGRPAGS